MPTQITEHEAVDSPQALALHAERSAEGAEADALTERIAQKLRNARLEVPALFFLEAHLPFVTFAHTLGLLLEPMALPLFGAERIAVLRTLLSDRANVELLIRKLEADRV